MAYHYTSGLTKSRLLFWRAVKIFRKERIMAAEKRYSINWDKNWDKKVGLWHQASGHTPPVARLNRVHSSREASKLLLLAAQAGQLERIDTSAILKNLRRMQVRDGTIFHGYLRWYVEEKHPADTNAPFFAGLPLIILWKAYRSALPAEQQDLLFAIFKDLYTWFLHESSEQSWFYPNKALGDIVCAWMLWEICDEGGREVKKDKGILSDLMLKAGNYWARHNWGWGEHLSDTYSGVCLDELSVLLLMSRKLPGKVREVFKNLFDEMLAIEDAYDKGPRVPALRSYAFLSCPEHKNYRDKIMPLPAEIDIANTPFIHGHTFYRMKWHEMAPQRKPFRKEIKIGCFDKAVATAYIDRDIRAGSVSRFPLMASMDRTHCGLSWQSMPVALSRPGKTWMFMQWETEELGKIRRHPAEDVKNACLNYGLSETVNPPIVGQTWSIQKGGAIMVLRIMPRISQNWSYMSDRLRLIGEEGDIREESINGQWHQLLIRWGKRELSVNCIPLSSGRKDSDAAPVLKVPGSFCQKKTRDYPVSPVLKKKAKTFDWNMTYKGQKLKGKRLIATLWAFSLDGRIDSAPEIYPVVASPPIPHMDEERKWKISWKWPGSQWKIVIDPFSSIPLKEKAS